MPLWFALGCAGLGLSIAGWLITDVRQTIRRHRQIRESVRRSDWMSDQQQAEVIVFETKREEALRPFYLPAAKEIRRR